MLMPFMGVYGMAAGYEKMPGMFEMPGIVVYFAAIAGKVHPHERH